MFVVKSTLQTMLVTPYWHLWYLYAYIAFIITLPFLRKMVSGLDAKSSIYMFVIAAFTMGIIPIIEYFASSINGNLQPSWLGANIFVYPVFGYVIDHVFNIEKLRRVSLLGIWGGVVCLIIGGVCEYFFLLNEPGNRSETFLTNFCLISASAIYITVKYLVLRHEFSSFTTTFITEIGKCTFGIYLLHVLILWKIQFIYNIWMKIEQFSIFGHHIGIFITTILVFSICGVITYGLRKIPFVCKLF